MDSRLQSERLTLGLLMCGVASLALSDFVSPVYWSLPVVAAVLRWWRGSGFALGEMQASLIGWFGFFWVGLELVLGRAWIVAFTDFLLILALAVTIEVATPRNHLHRMITGLFLILAAAVLTDSVLYAIPLLVAIWLLWRAASTLYGINQMGGDLVPPSSSSLLRWMGPLLLLAITLFVVMPRSEMRSLLQPTQPRMATSGFSDRVQLGDFSRQLDPTVVMRVEAPSLAPDQARALLEGRYWRGSVLPHFTGRGWQKTKGTRDAVVASGQSLRLFSHDGASMAMLYREATDHRFVMLPDGLVAIGPLPTAGLWSDAGELRFDRAPSRRVRLGLLLQHAHHLPPLTSPNGYGMEGKSSVPPVVRQWLLGVVGDRRGSEALQRVRNRLRSWVYDLNASLDDKDPIGVFLRNQRGHCELFATVLALSARELGFPARVVNGYFGGEWNSHGNFLLIRQQHAHSWVEVWQQGRWQRMDATPSARWQLSGVRFAYVDAAWEAVKLNWYRYVMDFQSSDRARLLQAMVATVGHWLPWVLLIVLVIVVVRRFRYRSSAPVFTTNWRVLDGWLRYHAITRFPHQPLRDVSCPVGVSVQQWDQFVQGWEQQVYGENKAWHWWQVLYRLNKLK